MTQPLLAAIALTALLHAPAALASAELARSKICMGCHAVERKLIGPSLKDVAARYAGQQDASAMLAGKIVKGSAGAWGAVPMPANPKITPDEARQLATWILSLK
jgi:cytochrome c